MFPLHNLQQSKEKQAHKMPSLQQEQNNPLHKTNRQDTLSEKHTKDDCCAITINETSPPMKSKHWSVINTYYSHITLSDCNMNMFGLSRICWIRESGSHVPFEHSAANTLHDRGVQRGYERVGACHCSYGN